MITGTSTGIGLETALLFARRGFRVYAGARNPVASEGLQRAVADGPSLMPIALDVDRDESVRHAVVQVGPVDALVNNAGIASPGAVELMPMEEIRAMFETNVFGTVRMMQAVLPFLRERRAGAIVNVTSMMGRITFPCAGYYAATKSAVAALTETLAMEVRPFGIRVANIEPGVILTPIWGKREPAVPEVSDYGQGLARAPRFFLAQLKGGTSPDVLIGDAEISAARISRLRLDACSFDATPKRGRAMPLENVDRHEDRLPTTRRIACLQGFRLSAGHLNPTQPTRTSLTIPMTPRFQLD